MHIRRQDILQDENEDRKRVNSRSFEKNSTGESRAPSIDRESTKERSQTEANVVIEPRKGRDGSD